MALSGIGVGGLLYSVRRRRAYTLAGLGITCLLEAFFVAVPLALGDHIAQLTLALQ